MPAALRLSAFAVLALACLITSRTASHADALSYLEGLKGQTTPFLAPSEIDPRYTIALYVNTAGKGANRQRMWVLHRDAIGKPWRLAMWDKDYWKRAKLAEGATPDFSWPVSTGRYYPGDSRSGPTPTGIFSLDERKRRSGRGWMQDGMIHVMHIDFHYSDGRMSGVAFHGTTTGRYRRLGSIDSHGCIRMHQKNALALLDRVTGKDGHFAEDLRWGEVPRYWLTEKGPRRSGYVRDGRLLTAPVVSADASGSLTATDAPASTAPIASGAETEAAAATPGAVLTKTGFRAITVMFNDSN
ncbi:MAG: L,D-transpeptidase [Hyphomicrobium sp.]